MSALAVLVKAVLSRQLDGTFVCLSAAVAEEHLFIACGLAQLLCKVCLYLGVVQVGGVRMVLTCRHTASVHASLQ